MAQSSLHARWIVPVSRPPIENGRVVMEDGRIVHMGKGARQSGDLDCGDSVVLPGLVNAHTHLELSRLRGRVPFNGSFVDWLRGVFVAQMDADEREMCAAVHDGFRQSLAAGVTTVVDIGCGQQIAEAWRASPMNLIGLSEVVGMGPRRFEPHDRAFHRVVNECRFILEEPEVGSVLRRIYGMSPHAPYSTAPDIYQRTMEYMRTRGVPLSTHLAETREECEFLAQGTGPFRDLLEGLGLWDGSFSPPGCSPVEHAQRLGLLAYRPILGHVNYVNDADIDLLARSGAAVAYCPRTHRFFEHPPHPYGRMLDRGVNVCLGTDSLASADSLSILDDLRFLRQIDSSLADEALLEMATVRGARAAGLEMELGSIDLGKRADLVVIPLSAPSSLSPAEDVLGSVERPAVVYSAGQLYTTDKLV